VSSGDEIFAFKMVASNYFSQTFWIDILSTFPLDEYFKPWVEGTIWDNIL